MRLRFRGASWDAPTVESFPLAPTDAQRSLARPSNPLLYFSDLLGVSPSSILRDQTLQPRDELASVHCMFPVQGSWNAQRGDRRQCRASDGRDDIEEHCFSKGGDQEELEDTGGVNIEMLASPPFCAVASDPAPASLPEPTFSEIMLADGHQRESLFSITQEVLLKETQLATLRDDALSTTTTTTTTTMWSCRPLRQLLESEFGATRETSRTDPSRTNNAEVSYYSGSNDKNATGSQQQQGFQRITLDLDAEILLRRLPQLSGGSLRRPDILDASIELDFLGNAERPEGIWRALTIDHLLRPLEMPPLSVEAAEEAPPLRRVANARTFQIKGVGAMSGSKITVSAKSRMETCDGGGEQTPHSMRNRGNPTKAFHLAGALGTFPRIEVEQSPRHPDLRLHDALERPSLLEALKDLNQEVRADTPHNCLGAQMGVRCSAIDLRAWSLPGRYSVIPLNPRRQFFISSGCRGECRCNSGPEAEGGRSRVGAGCTKSSLLWEALKVAESRPPSWGTAPTANRVAWLTTQTSDGCTARQGRSREGVLEISRVPLGKGLGEDPISLSDRLLAGILASWRDMHNLADTGKKPRSRVPREVATSKRSASLRPASAQAQQQQQPSSSSKSVGHSAQAIPLPQIYPAKSSFTREKELANERTGGKGGTPAVTPAVKQNGPLHFTHARRPSMRKSRSASKSSLVHLVQKAGEDSEIVVVPDRSMETSTLSKRARRGESASVMIGVGRDRTNQPDKSKPRGMRRNIAAEGGSSSEGANDANEDNTSKPRSFRQDNTIPNELHKELREPPRKRRRDGDDTCTRSSFHQVTEDPVRRTSEVPRDPVKVQPSQILRHSKPHLNFPPSFGEKVDLASMRRSSDVSTVKQQAVRSPGNKADAAELDGKMPRTTGTTPASANPLAQRGQSDGGNHIVPTNGKSTRRLSSTVSKEQTRSSSEIFREDRPVTPQVDIGRTGGDPVMEGERMEACESERHRRILSMIRAGAVKEAYLLCGGRVASGSPGKRGSASAASSSTTSRRAPEPGYEGRDCGTSSGINTAGRGGGKNCLCVIVSEHFIEAAGPTVLALSGGRRGSGKHETGIRLSDPSKMDPSRGRGVFSFLELAVEAPVDLVIGSRTGVVILDSGNTEGSAPVRRSLAQGLVGDDAGAVPEDPSVAEASLALVKEKFRLLTLQTLKFSRLWLIVQMDKDRVGSQPRRPRTRSLPMLERLEQWLVGFPCRVLLRYSHCEAHLAELITHAALSEQHWEDPATGSETVAVSVREKRRRLETALAAARSPLDSVEERSRNDPEWAAVHHRQAWFLQLFPSLNAFSASALLSAASLKHLIVSPYEELAPALLRREGGRGAQGSVDAESLRDFCDAIRFEEGRG